MEQLIESMIHEECGKALDFTTRAAVKMRVLLNVARILGISLQSIYDTKDMVQVDPSVSKAISILWNEGSLNAETVRKKKIRDDISDDVYERFLAKDFSRPADIVKLVSTLQRRFESSVLRDLQCLFAVDGLWSNDIFELENLSVPLTFGEPIDDNESVAESHVRAVRTLYRNVHYATPERIGETLRHLFDPVESLKRRGDGGTSPSSESEDSGGEKTNSDEDNLYDKYIADCYKRLVGKKIYRIGIWIGERLRIRTEEARKRTAVHKKPDEKINEEQESDKKIMSENQEIPEKVEKPLETREEPLKIPEQELFKIPEEKVEKPLKTLEEPLKIPEQELFKIPEEKVEKPLKTLKVSKLPKKERKNKKEELKKRSKTDKPKKIKKIKKDPEIKIDATEKMEESQSDTNKVTLANE